MVFPDATAARLALASAPTIGRLWLKPYAQVRRSLLAALLTGCTDLLPKRLAMRLTMLATQASSQCKQIAAKELHPPRLRPKTTDVVARRLVSNALQDPRLRDLVRPLAVLVALLQRETHWLPLVVGETVTCDSTCFLLCACSPVSYPAFAFQLSFSAPRHLLP